MADLVKYRNAVQQVLREYAKLRVNTIPEGDVEIQTIFDSEHDHY